MVKGVITSKTLFTVVLLVLAVAVGYLIFRNAETFVNVWGPKIAMFAKALARGSG